MLQQIGVYYPYHYIRDEGWLKTVALYWPRLARVVPANYPVADSDTARALADLLDFFVPVEPEPAARAIASRFLDVLTSHGPDLHRRYGEPASRARYYREYLARLGTGEPLLPPGRMQHRDGSPRTPLAIVLQEEVAPELREALLDMGLAVSTTREASDTFIRGLAMAPTIVQVYKCCLVEELALQGQFIPITDQDAAHIEAHGWDNDRIMQALIGEGSPGAPAQQLTDLVGMFAMRTVVPQSPDTVSVRQIVKLRRRHQAEFDAFSAAVTETSALLREELTDVSLPIARERYIQLEIERRFAIPLLELRRAMNGLKIDTAYSAANLKFELPAAVTATLGGIASGHTVMGTAAGAAFGFAGFYRSVSADRQARRASAPAAAYLLSIERGLAPTSLLRRLVSNHSPGAAVRKSPNQSN
jgi:hypothetical protein